MMESLTSHNPYPAITSRLDTRTTVPAPAPTPHDDDDHDGDRQFATTLARGLQLLRCFTAQRPALGNKELSLRSGLPKATVSRLTYTLLRLGYLRQDAPGDKYRLGSAVLSIGYPLLANLDIRQVARPYMRELAELSNGWVSIGVRDRLNMVYIETARSSGLLNTRPDIGQSFPIIAASMGRAYLAALPERARTALINEIKVKTPDLWRQYGERVEENLGDHALHGFCTRHGDFAPNAHSVGVGSRAGIDCEVIACNCAVPIQALKPRRLQEEIGPRLVQMVRSIEAALAAH